MSDFLKSLLLIVSIIIIINYEWKKYNIINHNNASFTIEQDYAKMLSDNIIKKIAKLDDNKAEILANIIDKFSQLNVITKNTGKGQSLVWLLYLHNIGNLPANGNLHANINKQVNNILDTEETLITLIYPNLIT